MAKVTLTREAAEGLEGLPLVIHARVLAHCWNGWSNGRR